MEKRGAYNPFEKSKAALAKIALGAVIATFPLRHVEGKQMTDHTIDSETAKITRINDKGDFIITRPVWYNLRQEDIVLGEGIRHMVAHGCKIDDIKNVNSGDMVKVKNPEECLPETK
jgi:hypothetical protein